MNLALDVVSGVLFVVGGVLAVVAAVGLHRLVDTRSRMHAATKPATLGVLSCAIGAAVQLEDVSVAAKLLVAVGFQLVTAPVGAHVLSRAITRSEDRTNTATPDVP